MAGGRVKIIAVVGTGSGCGKTTAVCSILRAIPGLGAVKISPRDGVSRIEWGPGEPGKDTDLYAGSGAVRVARIIGPRRTVGLTWELIKERFAGCPGVVIEGTSALDIPEERYVVFVVGDSLEEKREERNRSIASMADIMVYRSSRQGAPSLLDVVRTFLAGSKNG